MMRECDYSDQSTNPMDSLAALQNRVAELETLLAQKAKVQQDSVSPPQVSTAAQNSNPSARLMNANPFETFPALFFLDNEVFRDARISIPRPSPPVPEEIYRVLGNIEGLRDIAGQFFTTTHVWLPILSRKRFELLLSNPDPELTPDLALLFSAMKLVSGESSNCRATTRTNLYWLVKNYAVVLETNAVMTPKFLQANVLVAAYELGHAIYPSAYLSLGKCATLGKAYGLDDRRHAPQMLRKFGAWAELEELRRLWWAILLLDRYLLSCLFATLLIVNRYIHLGIPGHALATADPERNEVLPADDAQFDDAEMTANEPLYVASPTSIRAGPFTRTCQAAHLVGKVVDLLNEFIKESDARFTTALQVHRTLTAFIRIVQEDFTRSPEQYATALALAYTALIHLCDPFCCTDSNRGAHTAEEAELQNICISGITSVADDIARFALHLRPSMNMRHAAVSPLLGNCFYMAVVTFAWRVYEGEHSVVDAYHVLRNALNFLDGRWAVGGEYLQAVDRSKELLYDSPLL